MCFSPLRWLMVLALTVCGIQVLYAGGEDQAAGARRIGLGGAYTAVGGDYWALHANPAAMSGMTQAAAGLHVERRFWLQTLNYGSAGVALPFRERHWAGLDFAAFGSKGYQESRIGLAYAFRLIDKLSLGVKVNYAMTSIPGYGQAGALHADIGLYAPITKELTLGFRMFNANQAQLDKELQEPIPSVIALGAAWRPSEKVLLTADAEKQVDKPATVRGGAEYAFARYFRARVGFNAYPRQLTGGFGFTKGALDIDFAAAFHAQLGVTPVLSLNYRFGKNAAADETAAP